MIEAWIPGIHGRPTGGNLFNRHVLAYLEGVTRVERRVVREGEALPAPRGGPALVDSLLLAAGEPPGEEAAGCVLVAHYLQLFEPRNAASPLAARERRWLARLGGGIATSVFCRDLLVAAGLPEGRAVAVTPGLDSAFFAPPPVRPQGPARILTVATLLEGKGLRVQLGILESLAGLEWTWEIAGDPGLDPAFAEGFRRRLAESPVAGRVRLLGAVAPESMAEVYDRATIFVLASRFESCSIATMEAMARGLPVLAYRVGGIPERVPWPNNELLAPAGDPDRLRSSLRRLLEEPGEAAALGAANRQAGLAFPTWEQCGAAVWEFLSCWERGRPARA
jgi:glycosyltransferase involved in cell wall biosynthesis